eukprot:TRINITY_DN6294_c0_g1_i5.p1 TRINITY_DN6294_c0_g1~~TRINITY_DN6294_c0_g1_i5.p1  ORF type:complete len:197 (+),score=30.49 TRINITY_DN6294_c0_g1_i5:475-1065(+)
MMKVLTNTDKGIVIDAGANIGVYTILAASTGKTVFSFEPIPQHTEMIRRSLALNGWSNRVHLYRNGLADFRSKMKINFHTFNKGGATLNHLNTSVNKESDGRWAEEIEIETILLDDVLPHMQEVSDNLVFWKADIEGYESRMFRGSVKVFDYYEPNIIIFEILGKSFAFTECHLEKLLHAIMDLGYGLKNLRTKEF